MYSYVADETLLPQPSVSFISGEHDMNCLVAETTCDDVMSTRISTYKMNSQALNPQYLKYKYNS